MLISQGETYFQAQNKETIDVRENVISQPRFTIQSFRFFSYVVSNNLGSFFFWMCSEVVASFISQFGEVNTEWLLHGPRWDKRRQWLWILTSGILLPYLVSGTVMRKANKIAPSTELMQLPVLLASERSCRGWGMWPSFFWCMYCTFCPPFPGMLFDFSNISFSVKGGDFLGAILTLSQALGQFFLL